MKKDFTPQGRLDHNGPVQTQDDKKNKPLGAWGGPGGISWEGSRRRNRRGEISPGLSESGEESLAGILLMAGRSTRLGTPKALLPLGRRTLIEVVLSQVLPSRLAPIVLVLGDHYPVVLQAVSGFFGHPKLKIVYNPRFARGMSTSVRRGLKAIDTSPPGVMFLVGDQPLITTSLIDRLGAVFLKTAAPIVVPVYGGRPGNPTVFRKDLLPEFQRIRGDAGGRGLIQRYESEVLRVPIRPAWLGWDLDTWEDYERIKKRFEGSHRTI